MASWQAEVNAFVTDTAHGAGGIGVASGTEGTDGSRLGGSRLGGSRRSGRDPALKNEHTFIAEGSRVVPGFRIRHCGI